MSIAFGGLDTRYQGKIYLPFEYGDIEKPLYSIECLVFCVTKTLYQIRGKLLRL